MSDFGLSESVLSSIVGVIAQCAHVRRAMIYGSRAKGNYRHNSDIDIMLDGEGLTLADMSAMDCRLDDLLLPWQIDLVARDRVSNEALLREADKWGRVIFER